jgi:hypothetical protein
MLKRVVSVLTLSLLALTAFPQEHDHHAMTLEDRRSLARSLSKHGDVISQPANVEPTASVAFTITAHAATNNSASFAVSPSPFRVNQGDTVNITFTVPGNDFSTSHGILMDTYIESARTCNRGNSISISFVATTPGTFGFVCSVTDCSNAHTNMIGTLTVVPVQQAAPTVSSISPASGLPAGGTAVTITGSGFANNATVSFGGFSATNVSVVSSTSITCKTPPHGAGTVSVAVTNPDSQTGTLTDGFTYQNAAPTITSLDPASGPSNGGTSVTIHGTNFVNGATVTFGGTAATAVTFGSSSSLTATAPAHAAGNAAVVVTNPDTQSATFNSYQYVSSAVTVTNVQPSTGPTSGFTPVTITGTNFQAGAAVTFGGAAATHVTVVNATTITALTPFGPTSEEVGIPVPVAVTNPDSSSGSASLFTYSVPPLSISSIEPPAGPPAGGNVIEIIGAGFTTAVTSSVTVGGVAATNVQVIDAVTMKATVPPHAAGAVDVSVTVGGTTAIATRGYVYAPPPSKRRSVKH